MRTTLRRWSVARISRVLTLPQAPEGWRKEIEKIIAKRYSRHRDSYFNSTTLLILRHEETEMALRNLMHEANRRKIEFKLWFLFVAVNKCAVLSFPFKSELQENSKRSKKLLDALRTVQKDVGLISRFLGAEDEKFEWMLDKVLKSTKEYTRKKRGAPKEVTKHFCVVALQKYFIDTFGTPVLPAIDALLTATFSPLIRKGWIIRPSPSETFYGC